MKKHKRIWVVFTTSGIQFVYDSKIEALAHVKETKEVTGVTLEICEYILVK